ncbi:MAG TPA: hypothetical protein VMV29_07605 [Ktedonobacterales bacterium]|nr:hypothetical protein [Ktedonobacterales bacterium]
MIANIVLGMLLVWFTCVLVITIRAGADRREQDVLVSTRTDQRRIVIDESVGPGLASVEAAAQPEAAEVITASLTL